MTDRQGTFDSRSTRIALLSLVILTGILFLLPNWSWEADRFDSVVDGAIAVTIFVTSALLLLSQRFDEEPIRGLTLALMVTGVLRFISSAIDTENETIWLHRFCSLSFGVALLLESIPYPKIPRFERVCSLVLSSSLLLVLILGIAVSVAPEILPSAIVGHKTTPWLNSTSLIAAGLFYLSAWFRWKKADSERKDETALFVSCLLLGLPALLYPLFLIWSAQWWLFQGIEMFANSYLAVSLFIVHTKQLKDAKVRLREHVVLMERTLALVTHDIRNPLGVARTSAQMMLRSGAEPSMIERIIRNLEQIDSMIQSLLDVVRLRSGRNFPMRFKRCDLALEIHHMSEVYPPGQRARFCLLLPEPIWGAWGVDGIRRALDNLLTNAVKYGDPTAPIDVKLERNGGWVKISVHNEGPEIPLEEQAGLFDAFQRGSSTGMGMQGWGLGLALVKGIAELHGGTVSLVSNRSDGTTFTLELPIRTLDGFNERGVPPPATWIS